MTNPLAPIAPSTVDDPLEGWALPDHWSTAARGPAEVLSQRPDLAGAELSSSNRPPNW